MCLGSLLAAGQASAPQAPTAATPKAAPTPGQKPGSQAAPAEKSPSAKPQGPESKEVGPDAAVITIPGICLTPAPKAASSKAAGGTAAAKPPACETVVTRKQLELLIATVRPNLQPAQRRTLAQQYVELLAMSNAALQAGIEKDPKVQEQIRLSRLQILATSYSREMQQKEADVPQADIEKYYKEHAGQYEQAKLLRIYIPMVAEEGKPTDTAASKALAEKIQQSAASGEDFDKLQKEAFTASNSKGTPPPADLGERRRGTLPPKQEEAVFALKVGDVSPAIEEASGYFIYKVVSKDPVPLDRVRDEIKGMLAREHLRERMEKVRTSAKPIFNDAYFGKETQPAAAGELAPHPPAPSPQTPAPATPATPAPGTPEAPKTPPPAPPQVK
jgi:parvulin-like peptidyl-prolyl isomerase